MNNEVKVIVPDLGIKADDMTHGLKEYGNGSMLAGIRNIYMNAYREGVKVGVKKTILCGVIGMFTMKLVYEGGKWVNSKVKCSNKDSLGKSESAKVFLEEQVGSERQDMRFPWEKVKSHMKNNYNINLLSFETWIEPLVCNAYNDRILLELPDSSDVEIAYVKEEYKRLVQNSVYEVTGKKYIVSFVRPGEILIEDDI